MVFGLLLFSYDPLQNSLVTREAPRPLRGSAFGFAFLSVFGIGAIGAILAGWLLQQNQNAVLFLVLGLSMAASGTAALGVQRKTGWNRRAAQLAGTWTPLDARGSRTTLIIPSGSLS